MYVRELGPVVRIRAGYSFDEEEVTDWEVHMDFYIDGAWREGIIYTRWLGAAELHMSVPDRDDMTEEELEEAKQRLRELRNRVREDLGDDLDDYAGDAGWVRRILGRDLRHEEESGPSSRS